MNQLIDSFIYELIHELIQGQRFWDVVFFIVFHALKIQKERTKGTGSLQWAVESLEYLAPSDSVAIKGYRDRLLSTIN